MRARGAAALAAFWRASSGAAPTGLAATGSVSIRSTGASMLGGFRGKPTTICGGIRPWRELVEQPEEMIDAHQLHHRHEPGRQRLVAPGQIGCIFVRSFEQVFQIGRQPARIRRGLWHRCRNPRARIRLHLVCRNRSAPFRPSGSHKSSRSRLQSAANEFSNARQNG